MPVRSTIRKFRGMETNAEYWIEKLNLIEHPEGGFFRETYRSGQVIPPVGLPERFTGPRSFSTAIYFLITESCPSHLHRLKADELWHFYAGTGLTLHLFYPDGRYRLKKLGGKIEEGESFQVLVPADCWFGAVVHQPGGYTLAGCTVAPGFDFADFTLARRSELLPLFPDYTQVIHRLTRPDSSPSTL